MADQTKAWYSSKTIWAGIVAVAVAGYNGLVPAMDANFHLALPAIPDWIFAILGAFGVYGRTTANTQIK